MIKEVKSIFKEQFENVYMIRRLASYELRQGYLGSLLGTAWVFINPLMQIAVYWLVFGLGIRGGAAVEGVPYFVWMICGLIPWFFISAGIIQGANSIYSKLSTVSKMNFPLSVIPTYVTLAQLYTHLVLLAVLVLIVVFTVGFHPVGIIGVAYCVLSIFLFLIALSFITSTLSTISRDMNLLTQSITRMLFFLTPILWQPSEKIPSFLGFFIQLNPFYYIVEGYRKALLHGDIGFILSRYTLYFWGLTAIILLVGALFHIRFRKQFVDYL